VHPRARAHRCPPRFRNPGARAIVYEHESSAQSRAPLRGLHALRGGRHPRTRAEPLQIDHVEVCCVLTVVVTGCFSAEGHDDVVGTGARLAAPGSVRGAACRTRAAERQRHWDEKTVGRGARDPACGACVAWVWWCVRVFISRHDGLQALADKADQDELHMEHIGAAVRDVAHLYPAFGSFWSAARSFVMRHSLVRAAGARAREVLSSKRPQRPFWRGMPRGRLCAR
jgi:hypothetical protein